jgi:DNA-binding protein H-NS
MNMDRKYTIGLSVSSEGNRVTIDTDALQELLQSDWFRQFLKLQPDRTMADNQFQEAVNEIARLQQQMSQMRQQQMQPVQVQPIQQPQRVQMQPQMQQQQARPADELIKNIATAPAMAPPRRLPQSFMELNPDTMTESIWNSLNPEQQQQWLTYYKV